MKRLLPYIVLHAVVLFSTLGGICSKTAASKEFMSFEWFFFYGMLLLTLAVYAVVWQQVLKKIPLNIAYANKATGVIWTMLWGYTIFGENITVPRIIGCVLILAGIIILSPTGGDAEKEKKNNE